MSIDKRRLVRTALVLLAGSVLVGCSGQPNAVDGFAAGAGYANVLSRGTTGSTDIDRRICGSDGYVKVVVTDQGAGIVCQSSTGFWWVRRPGND